MTPAPTATTWTTATGWALSAAATMRMTGPLERLVDTDIVGRVASVADGVSDGQMADATCQD
jgi:hypothetical protein